MIESISKLTEDIVKLLRDDPVRPEIPADQRVNENSRIYLLRRNDQTCAVTCVKFLDQVPSTVEDINRCIKTAHTAVFYTIWSYVPGSAGDLIRDARQNIQHEFPSITTFVTLSPKTEMARRFHLRNGADVYRENLDTINYIYK